MKMADAVASSTAMLLNDLHSVGRHEYLDTCRLFQAPYRQVACTCTQRPVFLPPREPDTEFRYYVVVMSQYRFMVAPYTITYLGGKCVNCGRIYFGIQRINKRK